MNIPACTELGQNRLINSQTINFLGLTLDYTLSWSPHIARICNKLRSACYILRILKPTLTTQNLKTIYFAYFHSIMSYGIIFWGNSVDNDEVFKLQKRAIRVMTNSSNRTSCRGLLKELGILSLCSQYILSLALFVAKNMDDFTINSDIHPYNTRFNTNLHRSLARLTKYQKRGLLFWHQGLQLFTYKNKITLRGCEQIQTGTKKVSLSWILLLYRRIHRMDYPK